MSILESSDSPQVKLIHEWDQAFRKKDLDLIANCLHKDYRRTTYPKSIGKPEQTKEEWLKHITGVIDLWAEQESIIHSVIDTPGKVIIHVTNRAKTSIGIEMNRESIFIAHIVTDEDGTLKIKQGEEFTDSKGYFDTIQAVAAAKAKQN